MDPGRPGKPRWRRGREGWRGGGSWGLLEEGGLPLLVARDVGFAMAGQGAATLALGIAGHVVGRVSQVRDGSGGNAFGEGDGAARKLVRRSSGGSIDGGRAEVLEV